MKIPTTPPGGAPYYHGPPMNGMEMNPPWQANGVMVEGPPSAGNGSYIMPQQAHHPGMPLQPHHTIANPVGGYMSQQQVPGGGSYYPQSESEDSPTPPHNNDFSEYMWMENQEEFDKQVMQQLEEEALMEQCIEAMLADEREGMGRTSDASLEEQVSKSTLNPLAAEFVPSFIPAGSNSSPAVPSNVASAEVTSPPTETLKEITCVPKESSVLVEEKTQEEEQSTTNSESNIVVVSAKDVLTPKSSIDDTEKSSKSRERKDSDRKKNEAKKKGLPEISKKEKITVAAVTAAAVVSKSSTRPSVVRVPSYGERSKASSTDSKKVNNKKSVDKVDSAVTINKKLEIKVDDTVDLQGPPLPAVHVPVVSALNSTPVLESEKQSPPLPPPVFNYAAAARANLPPKQVTSTPQTQQAPKEPAATPNTRTTTSGSTTTAAKTQQNNAPNKGDLASRPKSAKPAEKVNADSKKPNSKKGIKKC